MPNSFKVLHDIGVLPATEGSEIKFSIDEYRNHKYGSIRKYLKRESYSGPTRSGITMNGEIAIGIAKVLEQFAQSGETVDEKELGMFAKRPGLSVKVRLTTYQGAKGIDLREWQEDAAYKGWTKRGIRLAYKDLPQIVEFLKKMAELMPAENK